VYQKFLQILQRYKEEGFAIAHVKAQVAHARHRYSTDTASSTAQHVRARARALFDRAAERSEA
jgi:hypothetical protein